jgi:CBS-domain-containing membrane protein
MKPKSFSITINGDRWKYRVLSDEEFAEIHADIGTDKAGVTLPSKKKIDFSASDLTFGKVVHELIHAYSEYLETGSEQFTRDQLEEMYACLMERRFKDIQKKADIMLANLQGVLNDESRLLEVSREVLPADDGDHQAKE